MTTELTQCPDCGKPSNNGRTCRLCDSEDALHKALTQRPAAQTEREAVDAAIADEFEPGHWTLSAQRAIRENPSAVLGMLAQLKRLQAAQQATPEPVGEPVGTVVHATLNGQAKPWVTVALNQDADLPNGTKLYTRPAPGVPESPRQLRKRFEQHMRDVFACKDTAFLSIDGGKTYLDGSMDNHWRTWLAAQAKGEVLAWSPALAQAEFNRAIDFAIKEGIGAAIFLDAWRHGDTSEWPEFAAAQAKGVE